MKQHTELWLFAGTVVLTVGIFVKSLHEYRRSFETVQPYRHTLEETMALTTAPEPPATEAPALPETACTDLTEPEPETETDAPETDPVPTISFPLDLNTADAEALSAIPGIGPERAAAIIAYRQSHGGFRNRAELLEVSGIGEVLYARLLDYVYLAQEEPLPPEPEPTPEPPPEPIPVINLNTAGKADLLRLPGCTEELAESILHLREEIGIIQNPYELLMAEGVSDELYLSWEPYLAVDDEGGRQLPDPY